MTELSNANNVPYLSTPTGPGLYPSPQDSLTAQAFSSLEQYQVPIFQAPPLVKVPLQGSIPIPDGPRVLLVDRKLIGSPGTQTSKGEPVSS